MSLDSILAALHRNPADDLGWLAIADCLEEMGQIERAELARLSAQVRAMKPLPTTMPLDERVRVLLEAGVRPCVPTIINSLGMTFVLIPPGVFLMGSPLSEPHRYGTEHPHEVELTRGYHLAAFPVTQGEFKTVMGNNPSEHTSRRVGSTTDRFPVETVSWDEAVAFCQLLGDRDAEKQAGRTYRLATEAEWEFACRGGSPFSLPFHFGSSLHPNQANFNGSYPYGDASPSKALHRPSVVGSYPPNAFGLYDMHGNVWEWCHDFMQDGYYQRSPRTDPAGPTTGTHHAIRGGAYNFGASACRCANRLGIRPHERGRDMGFRVVLVQNWD